VHRARLFAERGVFQQTNGEAMRLKIKDDERPYEGEKVVGSGDIRE